MRRSARIDYACKALLELSLYWPGKDPVQISTIAKNQHIPMKFLTQILLNLKQAGYVQSIRGKKGGYILAKSPRKIQLNELIENLGGAIADNEQNGHGNGIMDLIWGEIDAAVVKAMEEINFEIICDRKRLQDKAFVFQI